MKRSNNPFGMLRLSALAIVLSAFAAAPAAHSQSSGDSSGQQTSPAKDPAPEPTRVKRITVGTRSGGNFKSIGDGTARPSSFKRVVVRSSSSSSSSSSATSSETPGLKQRKDSRWKKVKKN